MLRIEFNASLVQKVLNLPDYWCYELVVCKNLLLWRQLRLDRPQFPFYFMPRGISQQSFPGLIETLFCESSLVSDFVKKLPHRNQSLSFDASHSSLVHYRLLEVCKKIVLPFCEYRTFGNSAHEKVFCNSISWNHFTCWSSTKIDVQI